MKKINKNLISNKIGLLKRVSVIRDGNKNSNFNIYKFFSENNISQNNFRSIFIMTYDVNGNSITKYNQIAFMHK